MIETRAQIRGAIVVVILTACAASLGAVTTAPTTQSVAPEVERAIDAELTCLESRGLLSEKEFQSLRFELHGALFYPAILEMLAQDDATIQRYISDLYITVPPKLHRYLGIRTDPFGPDDQEAIEQMIRSQDISDRIDPAIKALAEENRHLPLVKSRLKVLYCMLYAYFSSPRD